MSGYALSIGLSVVFLVVLLGLLSTRRVREKYAKVDRPASKKAELIRRAAEDGYLE